MLWGHSCRVFICSWTVSFIGPLLFCPSAWLAPRRCMEALFAIFTPPRFLPWVARLPLFGHAFVPWSRLGSPVVPVFLGLRGIHVLSPCSSRLVDALIVIAGGSLRMGGGNCSVRYPFFSSLAASTPSGWGIGMDAICFVWDCMIRYHLRSTRHSVDVLSMLLGRIHPPFLISFPWR